MKGTIFFRQAELILRLLPLIHEEGVFALKGGTAINYFVRDMPRLSVDIDLAYLPVTERGEALADIDRSLTSIAGKIKRAFSDGAVHEHKDESGFAAKLTVRWNEVTVKVEPNQVLRGAVYPAEDKDLVEGAQEMFELFVRARTLATAELYGGKICAALDRQHPRDFFDVKVLFDYEGLTEEIRKAFIVYLISHPRPMGELVDPRFSDMRHVFENEFQGLTRKEVTYEELTETRGHLVELLRSSLTPKERRFIISVQEGMPRWDLLGVKGVEKLPAIRWKLFNVEKMSGEKKKQAVSKLRDYFEV